MNILRRIQGMIFSPQAEWESVANDPRKPSRLFVYFLLPLCLVGAVASLIGMLVFNANWNADFGYAKMRSPAPVVALATFAFEIISVYMLAAVLYLLARTEGKRPDFFTATAVAVFGSIPVLLAGAALVIPSGALVLLVAAMYSFYLYHLGAVRLFGINAPDAAMFVGVAMIGMMVLSGILGGIASALGVV